MRSEAQRTLGFPGPDFRTWETTNTFGLFLRSALLTLRDAARQLFDLLLLLAARSSACGLGGGCLAGCPFNLLAFLSVFDLGGVCH
jgi:hypothetical protein